MKGCLKAGGRRQEAEQALQGKVVVRAKGAGRKLSMLFKEIQPSPFGLKYDLIFCCC